MSLVLMVRCNPKYFYFSFTPLVSSNATLLLIIPIFSRASFSLEGIASTLPFLPPLFVHPSMAHICFPLATTLHRSATRSYHISL
ncbi:hypothetical protein B0H19DRAFT_1182007 [Mycena capillaripes]|nr:hypothetical protein B0H19DRAFT_1182007 [Mycena capillaripes]